MYNAYHTPPRSSYKQNDRLSSPAVWLPLSEDAARISVLKEERKQGTGRLLLDMLKQISKERQIGKVLLDVRRSNAAARAFYEKYGFKEDGIRPDFYENPSEDAILMSAEILTGE